MLPIVIVVPLTTKHRRLDVHVEIEPDADNGLAEVGDAQCESVQSIGAGRLVHRLGRVTWEVSTGLETRVRDLLGD